MVGWIRRILFAVRDACKAFEVVRDVLRHYDLYSEWERIAAYKEVSVDERDLRMIACELESLLEKLQTSKGDNVRLACLFAWLEDEDERRRAEACLQLSSLGDVVLKALVRCLEDSSEWVRESACTALGLLGNPVAVLYLRDRLSNDTARVRARAIEALVRLRAEGVLPDILKYADDKWYLVRYEICMALKAFGGVENVDVLIKYLSDESDAVREAACYALGEIRDVRAVEPLLGRLRDSSEWVRKAACEALGRIGDTRALVLLTDLFSDPDPLVRLAAENAYALIKDLMEVDVESKHE